VSDILKNLIKQFMPFAQKHIGFEKPPRLFLKQDPTNAKDPLGKTAYYDPAEMSVTLYTTDRHPKDILRSLGHELVHHKQNCEGKFDDVGEMGEGYAQTNPHLRQMEVEANRDGSMCLRDFTDTLMRENTIYFEHLQKGDTNMSTKDWKNGELKGLLTEAWGFQMDLSKLNEAKGEKGKANPLDGKRAGFDADLDGAPDGGDADKDDPDVQEEGAFAPNHYCVHHGGVQREGQTEMAEAVNHNYNEDLGRVTHYDMKFKDGTIMENVAFEDIQVTDASLAEDHSHPGARDDENELEEGGAAQRKDDPRVRRQDPDRLREEEEEEEFVKEEFPGESDMNTHKRDLSEARLKEIIAYALKTKG
jgi:hypothetical protein